MASIPVLLKALGHEEKMGTSVEAMLYYLIPDLTVSPDDTEMTDRFTPK